MEAGLIEIEIAVTGATDVGALGSVGDVGAVPTVITGVGLGPVATVGGGVAIGDGEDVVTVPPEAVTAAACER
jgi:hypothetical protein